MAKINKEEYNKLILSLYKNADKELKSILKKQMEIKGRIMGDISNILLIYSINNDVMNMTKAEQDKEIQKLGGIIKTYAQSGARTQIKLISELLGDTVQKQCDFLEYNIDQKDVQDLVKKHYKGKHFSERIWENEQQTATQINKTIVDFVKGKVSVNEIKEIIDDKFNNGAYNTKRLVETEVARIQYQSFDKFADFVGVKKVRYNAELDSKTCECCSKYDGKVFDYKNKYELPMHPLCRCYYDIMDDETETDIKEKVESDSYYNKQQQEQPKEKTLKATNRNGKEIEFNLPKMKESHKEKVINTITELSNIYNTRLLSVSNGKSTAGEKGHVDLEFKMNLSTSKLDTVVHEFAHSLSMTKADKLGLTNDADFWKEIKKVRKEYHKAIKEGNAKEISEYSLTSVDEFMCEAFTHAYLKDTGELGWEFKDDYTYSQKVLNIIDKYFKKK